MNEYIVQIISATRLWLISRYSHHTLKKRRKMTAKNRHPCTEWFLSLCLQTNRKHMENQSLICTRKTLFYTDNITSLMIVVFSTNWSRMFALLDVRCVVNSNWKLWTTKKWQHRFRITGNVVCVPIHAFALHSNTRFFSSEVLHKIWRIFPRSFDIIVTSDVPTRYLIFCTKQRRKQSLFYWQHPACHVTFSEWLHSPSCMACLCSETLKGVL